MVVGRSGHLGPNVLRHAAQDIENEREPAPIQNHGMAACIVLAIMWKWLSAELGSAKIQTCLRV